MARNLSEESKRSKAAYDARYMREHIRKKTIMFNCGSREDMEIYDWISKQSNQTQYIKDLVKEDMGTGE